MKYHSLIGIDEAGRGPLAGPIAVGAFAVTSRSVLKLFAGVKESKQLTAKQREEWFSRIQQETKKGTASFAVSFCRADVIDKMGLTWATSDSLRRCLKKLSRSNHATFESRILLDGLLHAPASYASQKTIIDGDAKEPIIALASICAKVLRDRLMMRLDRLYPSYGFEAHKGYGTKRHFKALREYGLSPVHRRSFLRRME